MGGHTIEKVTKQFRVQQFGSYLTKVWSAKRIPRSFLDSDYGFESENVNLAHGVVELG